MEVFQAGFFGFSGRVLTLRTYGESLRCGQVFTTIPGQSSSFSNLSDMGPFGWLSLSGPPSAGVLGKACAGAILLLPMQFWLSFRCAQLRSKLPQAVHLL